MQTEEQAKFRLNWQAAVVLGILIIALAVPVALVFAAFKGQKKPAAAPAAESVSQPLEKALEAIVDQSLPGAEPVVTSNREVVVAAADPEARARELEKIAATLGGTSLPAERQGQAFRLVVSMPAGRLAEFNQAVLGDGFETGPKAAAGETGVLVTILVTSQSAP